jgi:hypothetical protein
MLRLLCRDCGLEIDRGTESPADAMAEHSHTKHAAPMAQSKRVSGKIGADEGIMTFRRIGPKAAKVHIAKLARLEAALRGRKRVTCRSIERLV